MVRILKEDIEIHDKLNPKIWDKNNSLHPQVKSKINDIVNAFLEYVEVPIKVADIHILGSNASFNYTDKSDLDVHIVANFDLMNYNCDPVLQAYYNSARSAFNEEYDITIKGINVEMYVEDIKANTVSNGIYSIYKDDWVKFPSKIPVINVDIQPELLKTVKFVKSIINSNQLGLVEDGINSLYIMRKSSLATDGEYGEGNLIFKEIRNMGLLDKLRDKRAELISRDLSLEQKRRQQQQEDAGYFTIDRIRELMGE